MVPRSSYYRGIDVQLGDAPDGGLSWQASINGVEYGCTIKRDELDRSHGDALALLRKNAIESIDAVLDRGNVNARPRFKDA